MAIIIKFGIGIDWIAFGIAIIYTLVPIAFFYQYSSGVIKTNKVSILGILFLYLNGLTYFLGTIQNKRKRNRTIELNDFSNLSGAILGFGYCLYYFYIIYFKTNKKIFFFGLGLTLGLLLIIILISFFIPVDILEYAGVAFNILEYLPLGFDIIYLIKKKVSEKYTLFSAIPGIINTIIWLVWAAIKVAERKGEEKYHSLVANILGFLLCLFQFIMFFFFNKEVDEITEVFLENEEIKINAKEEGQKEGDDKIKEIEKEEKEEIGETISKKENSEFDEFL